VIDLERICGSAGNGKLLRGVVHVTLAIVVVCAPTIAQEKQRSIQCRQLSHCRNGGQC